MEAVREQKAKPKPITEHTEIQFSSAILLLHAGYVIVWFCFIYVSVLHTPIVGVRGIFVYKIWS